MLENLEQGSLQTFEPDACPHGPFTPLCVYVVGCDLKELWSRFCGEGHEINGNLRL